MYKLSIDAMSGDLGPSIVVDACLSFVKNHEDAYLYVTGRKEDLTALDGVERIEIVDARDVIDMEAGIMVVRRKKDSSMVKAVVLANDGISDGVVSCGSTGAFYTSAMLFLKRIEGIEKSCLMANIPNYDGKGVLMLDVGANAENTAEQLKSFATMGNVYAKTIKGIQNPRIALLNIGTESKKGNEVHQQTYKLLSEDDSFNFVGNIECRNILLGECDVVVTDGFSGNIALKTLEGTASLVMTMVKEAMMSSLSGKIGALFSKKCLRELKSKFDYKSVGGALMIGFEKPVVKAHGASDSIAFMNAMELAYSMVKHDVVKQVKEGLK